MYLYKSKDTKYKENMCKYKVKVISGQLFHGLPLLG